MNPQVLSNFPAFAHNSALINNFDTWALETPNKWRYWHFSSVIFKQWHKSADWTSLIKHYTAVTHTVPAHTRTVSAKLSFFFSIYRKRWLHEESGLGGLALIYEAFQLLSLVIQTHADCQKRHDSRQRGIFFNALSQQCAYTVDKGMLAAVEQIERERVRGEHEWVHSCEGP